MRTRISRRFFGRPSIQLTACLLAFLFASQSAFAEPTRWQSLRQAASWHDQESISLDNAFEVYSFSTPSYEADLSDFKPRLGTYVYRVSWQGIGAAEIEVSVEQEGLDYRVRAKARTNSFIDVFYKLRYDSEGLFSSYNLRPKRTVVEHKENSREKVSELFFDQDGTIRAKRWRKGRTQESYTFRPENLTLDPFSAGFLARSMDWYEGRTTEFDTFNGKTRYLISLTAKEKRRMKINGKLTEVWVIVPSVRKSTEAHAHKKLNRAEIYVTADEHRDILQLSSSVFVGTVDTKLKSFTPSRKAPPGPQMASWRKVRISSAN